MTDKPLSILLVEDNPGDVVLVREALADSRQPVQMTHAPSLAIALDLIARNHFDSILLDLSLGDSTGIATLEQAYAATSSVPIIVLTGLAAENTAIEAIRKGAQDYLIKGETGTGLLVRTIRHAIERKRMEKELAFKTALLEAQAETSLDGILVVDGKERAILFNQRFADIWRLPQETLDSRDDEKMLQHSLKQIRDPERFITKVRDLYAARDKRSMDVVELKDGRIIDRYSSSLITCDGEYQGRIWFFRDVTERKRTEEALQTLADEWQTTFDAVGSAVWLLDGSGRIVRANQATRDVLKIDPAKVVGRHCWEIVHGTAEQPHDCPITCKGEGLKRESGEMSVGDRWYEVTVDPVRDHDGHLSGAVHIISDITERKRVEEALLKNESQLRLLVENAGDMIARHDPDSTIRYISPSCRQLLGYEPNELLHTQSADYVHPEDIETTWQKINAAVAARAPEYRIEHRVRHKSGDYVWVETVGHLFYTADGALMEIQGASRDIAKRKRAEESLRRSEETFSKAYRASPAAITITRLNDSRLVEVNEAFESLMGYSRTEVVGHTAVQLGLWVDLSERERNIRLLLAEGRVQDQECRFRTKGGEVLTCRYSAVIIELSGEPCGLVTLVDMTERKRAEEALRESEERFSLAMDAAEEGLWDRHIPTGRIYRSPRFYTMLGYEVGEVSESFENWADLIHPDDRMDAIRRADAILDPGLDTFDAEYRFRAKDGQWRWIRSCGKVVERDAGGRAVRTTGTHVDITERKRAEEALRESEARFRQVFDHMHSGLAVFGAVDDGEDFIFRDYNEAAESLDQVSKDQVLGQSVLKVFPGVRDFGLFEVFQRVWRTGQSEHHPLSFYQDGRISGWRDNFVCRLPSGEVMAIYEDVSERKRAEEAIRKSEAKYRHLYESMIDAFGSADMTGRIVEFNQAYRDMLGYTEEELRQLTYMDLTPEKWHAFERRIVDEQIMTRGYSDVYEKEYRRKDGTVVPVELRAVLIRDDAGQAVGIWGLVRDITKRKRAEQEQEGLGRLAVRLAACTTIGGVTQVIREESELLLDWDAHYFGVRCGEEGYFETVSVVDTVGGVKKTFPGEKWLAFKPEETALINRPSDESEPELHSFGDMTQSSHSLMHVPVRSGNAVTAVLSVQSYTQGRYGPADLRLLQRIADVVAPALERVRAEEALRESEAKFRQLAENLHEVFWLGSPGLYEVLYISPAYEEIWGRSCQSLYEQPESWMNAVLEEDRSQVVEAIRRTMAEDPTTPSTGSPVEYRIKRPDGSMRWILARSFPIPDEHGKIYRVAGICEDITERKRAEGIARRHESDLAHAWRISAMGEMASGIAHELNQPLFAIMVYVEACRIRVHSGKIDPNEMIQDLDRVMVAAEAAGDIIQRLRNFIRKREPQRSTFDVNAIIGEAMHFVEAQAKEKSIQIRLQASAALPTALGDSILTQQVILNLARNAIDAMGNSETPDRRLTIQTRSIGPDLVEVLVRDNGPGISDDLMLKLFQPFFTTKREGLGLGLSISQSIIEANGGHLVAERNPEGGMTFRFTLPVSTGGSDHGT